MQKTVKWMKKNSFNPPFIYGGEAFFSFKLAWKRKPGDKIIPGSMLFVPAIVMNFSETLLL